MSQRLLAWAEEAGNGAALTATGWTPQELAELIGLDPEALARLFAVVPAEVLDRAPDATIPMTGTFRVEGGALWFRSRHPFADGTEYALVVRSAMDGRSQPVARLRRPAPTRKASTVVTGIFPTAETLPLNALRFYLHFSAPMSEGFVTDAVRLVDVDSRRTLDGALFPMEPELWDEHRTRLTVLLDPARIKRGLVPHTEAGYPLALGGRIALVVDARFPDASGTPLAAGAERRYSVGPPVRRHLDPACWSIEGRAAGDRRPLRVRAERPLDHALAQRCLSVVDRDGRTVRGEAALSPGELEWAFTPTEPWRSGPCTLVVASMLEDVAGNSITRVFDRDLGDADHDPRPGRFVALPLEAG